MKKNIKVLIRFESYGLGGIETRISSFSKILEKKYNYKINFLTNKNYENIYGKKILNNNLFSIFGILKEIFEFKKYGIIETNGLRDPIITIINYLLFFPFYKINGTKLIIVIHGVLWLKKMNFVKKNIYKIILSIGIKLSYKTIAISEEVKRFILKKFFTKNKQKINIILNYIEFSDFKNKDFKEKKGILLSRIDKTKINGIIDTINFCNKNNIKLDIYGNGNSINILKKYENNFIKIKGEKNINEINFDKYNIVFGMGRALLDGISKGLFPILIGYNEIITTINESNYLKIKETNFSGRGINKENKNNITDKINIKNTVKIYEKIKNDFDINKLEDYYK